MHWLEDASSFELFSDIMNLNPQQRTYARRLKPGEAIVRSRFGRPVHIYVSPIRLEPTQNTTGISFQPDVFQNQEISDIGSDAWLAANMPARRVQAGLELPSLMDTNTESEKHLTSAHDIALRIYTAPKGQFCSFCRPRLASGECPYKQSITNLRLSEKGDELDRLMLGALMGDQRVDMVTESAFVALSESLGLADQHALDATYCLAAHVAKDMYTSRNISRENRLLVKGKLAEVAMTLK